VNIDPAARGLHGTLRVPGDKSISHRALMLAALARGTSTVTGLSQGDDVHRTRRAIEAMGAVVVGDEIHGGRTILTEPTDVIDVGNSGTGIRLLAGMCAGLPWRTVLDGDASIRRRPMDRIATPLRAMGARIFGDQPPLTVDGGELHGIDYTLPMASAQVKSAVLFAGINAEGETVVREPAVTRRHTEELLALAGVAVEIEGPVVRLQPGPPHPFTLAVPGDPSQAAFWVVAATIVPGSELTIEHVYVGPARGRFIDVLHRMGADIEIAGNDIHVRAAALNGTTVSGDEIPGVIDEIPVLAVAGACAEGETHFRDAAELAVKESNRIETTAAMLRAFGVACDTKPDGLAVSGGAGLRGAAVVDAHGDHRIAMAGAVAALVAAGSTTIEGWDAVATSYPGFEQDLRRCVS
jgi:3-phosphoshikimate 1-carboxyvinyltransferase